MSRWTRGELEVRWLSGGVWLQLGDDALLLDAPPGCEVGLSQVDRGALRAVALSSGHVRAVGGLVGLLCALEPARRADLPLELHTLWGEERGPMLAEAWVRGWTERYPITLDVDSPGAAFEVGPFHVEPLAVPRGEPRWLPEATVESVLAQAFRVDVDGVRVAYLPGCGPGTSAARVLDGVDLAIVEVGVVPWPRTERRWRLSSLDAATLIPEGTDAWLVGDDGRMLGAES